MLDGICDLGLLTSASPDQEHRSPDEGIERHQKQDRPDQADQSDGNQHYPDYDDDNDRHRETSMGDYVGGRILFLPAAGSPSADAVRPGVDL